MQTKADHSYGVVPLFGVDGKWHVLLIHQRSYRGDTFWIFPKGHAEEGESPQTAALRELKEETGLTAVTLEDAASFTVGYSFVHEGVLINKEVKYFIGYCMDQEVTLTQPQEVVEMRWCTFAEAEELLLHQNSKDVLKKVEAFLYKT